MEQLRILIADDEQSARELISYYLGESGISSTKWEAADGLTALRIMEKEKPDLVFLDIKMPGLSGIEVVEKKPDTRVAVIFTTAYDQFAIPAFDHEAVDYLLKPFLKERFDKALEKAIRYIELNKVSLKKYSETILVKNGTKSLLIPVLNINYFQADGAYIQGYTDSRSFLLNDPLYELEEKLDPLKFCRIHKSLIVNSGSIKQLNSLPNGDFVLLLHNGKELRGSRNYKKNLLEIIR